MIGFIAALKICETVMADYKRDHLKWWKRMDGTPILNDLPVRMATAFINATHADATDGWQSIETAPKDDEIAVLGYQQVTKDVWVIGPMYCKDGEWLLLAYHSANTEFEMQPSHWIPLPEKP